MHAIVICYTDMLYTDCMMTEDLVTPGVLGPTRPSQHAVTLPHPTGAWEAITWHIQHQYMGTEANPAGATQSIDLPSRPLQL